MTAMTPPAAVHDARFDVPALSARAIESWLADGGVAAGCQVEAVDTTGSTNDDLILRARRAQPSAPILRVADHQSGGRGRQGRTWLAQPRHAVLMSLAVALAELPSSLPSVTLACGTALADELRARGVAVRLKWPNDLLYDDRKLAGLLSELAVDEQARYTLVVGVGINLHLNAQSRSGIGKPAAALDEVLPAALLAAEREAWIGRFGAALLGAIERFVAHGFGPFRTRYNELLQGRGSEVDVVDGERVITGRLVEVDGSGRLVIETASGPRLVSAGELSWRAAST